MERVSGGKASFFATENNSVRSRGAGGAECSPGASATAALDDEHELPAATTTNTLVVSDEGVDEDDGTLRPGAYRVPGMALGEYPVWGHANDAAEAGGETAVQEDEIIDPSAQSFPAFVVDEEEEDRGGRPRLDNIFVVAEDAEQSVATHEEAAADDEGSSVSTSFLSSGVVHPVIQGVPCPESADSSSDGNGRKSSNRCDICGQQIYHWRFGLLIIALIVSGAVIGVTVTISGRLNDSRQQVEKNEGNISPGDENATENGESELWRTIGSPILGLKNESGAVAYLGKETGELYFGYGPTSNFTFSGFSISLSDDCRDLAVGEAGTDTVRIFQWNETKGDWTQKGQTIKSLTPSISFGSDLNLSGDGSGVVVASTNYQNYTGMVSTYQWNPERNEWTQFGMDHVGYNPFDMFGTLVKSSFSGRTIIAVASQSMPSDGVGSPWVKGFKGRGYARVFDWDGMEWVQRGDDVMGHNEHDGLAFVDITRDGQTIVFGTLFGGHVDVYDWNRTLQQWTRRGKSIIAPSGEADFGSPVLFSSQDGDRLVIGSQYIGNNVFSTTDANLLYVYEWDGTSWLQLDRLVVLKKQSGGKGRFKSVDVSFDGSILVIAFVSGVQVFEWNGSGYFQKGKFVEGGLTVSLCGVGEVFAVGRPFDNTFGFGLGYTTTHAEADSGFVLK